MSDTHSSRFSRQNSSKKQLRHTLKRIDVDAIVYASPSQFRTNKYDACTVPPHNCRYLALAEHLRRYPMPEITLQDIRFIASCSSAVAERYMFALTRDCIINPPNP
jgi:hypothetical protein